MNTACRMTIRGARYKVRKYIGRCSLPDPLQCMHPGCPDFDLCSNCEALPIPVHPLNHPMLKLKTSNTVIPTVYRIGQTQTIDEPVSQKSVPVGGESRSSAFLFRSPLAEDLTPFAEEFLSPLGSPASDVLGAAPTSVTVAPSHLLVGAADPPGSPRSIHCASDIYHQLRSRVNQEMMHLNAVQPLKAGDPVVDVNEDTVTDAVAHESLVAEESLPGTPAISSVSQAGEHHGTCPISPVPGANSIVDGYLTPSSILSNVQESNPIAQQLPADGQQEIVVTNSPRKSWNLDSALVGDTNVPDGQIFPPGAEFVKGWHMMNDGSLPWPTTTEIQFVAGEMFASEWSAALKAKVGVVHPGQDLDIWTGDLKVCARPYCNSGEHVADFCAGAGCPGEVRWLLAIK